MDLVYFSGPQNKKILKDKNFYMVDPLKYTSFFLLTLQKLVDFSGPKN